MTSRHPVREFADRHPELAVGEVLFRNMTRAEFDDLPFATKRLGITAYDGEGRPCHPGDWRPVFVSFDEVVASGRTLSELRREQRDLESFVA